MPEGPEVRAIGDVISNAIDTHFKSAEIIERPNFKHKYVRNGIPNLEKLTDFKISQVSVVGKLIAIDISTPEEDLIILNTLGMTGTWIFDNRDNYHARINFSGVKDLTFVDQRSFGTFKIVNAAEAAKRISKIGHDLLHSPMDSDKWESLRGKIGHKEIGVALMEQKHFSGIGNIYKAETLYACKIHPKTLIKDLTKEEWAKVNHQSHEIMRRSYLSGGSTVKSYVAGNRKGKFQRELMVYKRKTCPEDHLIESVEQAKRTTWYCETCQA